MESKIKSVPPFVWIRDQAYVVANWNLEMEEDEWLVLRPLSSEEEQLLAQSEEDLFAELYYTLPQITSKQQNQREPATPAAQETAYPAIVPLTKSQG